MIPQLNLFNQLFYRSDDGFTAIICYYLDIADINVYTPDGEWCGATRATNHYTRMADIRNIISYRKQWQN